MSCQIILNYQYDNIANSMDGCRFIPVLLWEGLYDVSFW